MRNIRFINCNGRLIDPKEFRGQGIRGWWIRVLNVVRAWLERKVIYHVTYLEGGGEHFVFHYQKDDVPLDTTTREHFTQARPKPTIPTGGSIEGHLKTLRKRGVVENPRDITARVMARYAANPRARNYAFGRGHRIMMEAEEEPNNVEGYIAPETVSVPEESKEGSRVTKNRIRAAAGYASETDGYDDAELESAAAAESNREEYQ
jgi:cell division protein YceG involved in septum cleavage